MKKRIYGLAAVLFVVLWAGISAAAPVSKTETVTVKFGGEFGFTYNPRSVHISPGDTVQWEGDFSFHPLASDDGLWPTVNSGTEFIFTFDQPGIYPYHCTNHGGTGGVGMSGVVVVGSQIFLPAIIR